MSRQHNFHLKVASELLLWTVFDALEVSRMPYRSLPDARICETPSITSSSPSPQPRRVSRILVPWLRYSAAFLRPLPQLRPRTNRPMCLGDSYIGLALLESLRRLVKDLTLKDLLCLRKSVF
jgi:hypothetical protein